MEERIVNQEGNHICTRRLWSATVLLNDVADVLELFDGQIDGQLERVLRQTVYRSERIPKSRLRHIAVVRIVLLNQIRALVDQVQPLGELLSANEDRRHRFAF